MVLISGGTVAGQGPADQLLEQIERASLNGGSCTHLHVRRLEHMSEHYSPVVSGMLEKIAGLKSTLTGPITSVWTARGGAQVLRAYQNHPKDRQARH